MTAFYEDQQEYEVLSSHQHPKHSARTDNPSSKVDVLKMSFQNENRQTVNSSRTVYSLQIFTQIMAAFYEDQREYAAKNVAHVRQSRLGSGLGSQVKMLKTSTLPDSSTLPNIYRLWRLTTRTSKSTRRRSSRRARRSTALCSPSLSTATPRYRVHAPAIYSLCLQPSIHFFPAIYWPQPSIYRYRALAIYSRHRHPVCPYGCPIVGFRRSTSRRSSRTARCSTAFSSPSPSTATPRYLRWLRPIDGWGKIPVDGWGQ